MGERKAERRDSMLHGMNGGGNGSAWVIQAFAMHMSTQKWTDGWMFAAVYIYIFMIPKRSFSLILRFDVLLLNPFVIQCVLLFCVVNSIDKQ